MRFLTFFAISFLFFTLPVNAGYETIRIGEHTFEISIADTPEKRAKGLMHVKNMPDNNGMLFKFESPRVINMWMKNTYIPLDMIFINENHIVIGIAKNTTPHSLENISSKKPAMYVLEINGGLSDKYNIKIGDKVYVTK